ncbi:hypothetical protein [Streptomyces sp. NPDC002676]
MVGAGVEDGWDPHEVLVSDGDAQAGQPGEQRAEGDLELGAGEGGAGLRAVR